MKKFFALVVLGASVLSASFAFAEASSSERSVTGFFRRLFNYPVKATEATGKMTANTVQNTGEKIVAPLVSNPPQTVSGTLETAGQTVAETAQIPVKAAEESPAPAQ